MDTTVISPGAVATELVDSITEPDIAANVRQVYDITLPAKASARMVAFAAGRSPRGGAHVPRRGSRRRLPPGVPIPHRMTPAAALILSSV